MDSKSKNITLKPIARYFITDTFKITGRGLVFLGNLTEGEISPGNILEFAALETVLYRKITGVDYPRMAGTVGEKIGVLIRCESEIEIDKLRNAEPNNQFALVYESETPDMDVPIYKVNVPKPKRTWLQKLLNVK